MDDKRDDIFKEAAKISLSINTPHKENPIVEESEVEAEEEVGQAELAVMHTSEGDKWDDLTNYMNGAGATRLLKELQEMSSRDYVRNYLKLLEHFKPKLVRSDSSPDGDIDRTIQIEMVQQLPDGEIRTIKINKQSDEDE